MTLGQARKILGKESANIPDEELQRDIETAELFKELFFSFLASQNELTDLPTSS